MKNLCVIFGGASSEHDISVITAMQLKKNYQKEKLQMLYMGLDNKFYLATEVEDISFFANNAGTKLKEVFILNGAVFCKKILTKKLFDIGCVINCCHGGAGEDGDLAGFLNINGIKWTSSNSLSAHIAMDKYLSKLTLNGVVPTIKGELVTKENIEEKRKIIENEFSNNLIVKPNSMGSSIGVKVCSKKDYLDQVYAIFELGDNALVEERVVDIVEYNQACFRDKDELVLSVIERPLSKSNFLTFDDKYCGKQKSKGKDREIPAIISKQIEERIVKYTKLVYSTLNFNGVVRVDYIYDQKKKELFFNEVNTVPGSMAFYLFEPMGIDYISLVDKLVENSLEPKLPRCFDTNILTVKSL